MGKHKSWKQKKVVGKQNRERNDNQKGVRLDYEEIKKDNADFETYYKLQKICPEEEWDAFMKSLRESLPTTFRITGSRSQAKALLHIIENQLIKDAVQANTSDDSSESEVDIKPLPWYPEDLAWQLNLTRKDIRRNEAYFRLHNFLIAETTSGNISRQEAVSMIPPLALQVEPHHKVLDMCAAPGSKTAQIIESLHSVEGKNPDGFVVANDLDNKRCYMLVHQGKRLQSPSFIVTNHEAGHYPDLYLTNSDGTKRAMKFDRVLCDVPCSGDGTLRKNIDVWKKWSTSNGMALHTTQYQILRRGLELLEVGGLLVYSTCSLNPMEDEAVIHRALKEAKDSVKLLDINLPNLKCSKGISHWVPCSRDMVAYSKPEEILPRWLTTVLPCMFPPAEDEAKSYNLDKCIRVLPHHQDTGGFFIALLTKTAELPWEAIQQNGNADGSSTTANNGASTVRPPPRKKPKYGGYREDPFIFMKEDESIWPAVRQFYDLDSSLKSTNFLRRCSGGKIKNIYLTTEVVRDFVMSNEKAVKIINVGVKALARVDKKWGPCDFRISQEGLPALLPYINGRIVTVTKEDLTSLLMFDDVNKPPELDKLSEATKKQVENLAQGSVVLQIDTEIENGGPKFRMVLVGWRGKASLKAYVQKDERIHYLRLCGGDVAKFEKNKFKDKDGAQVSADVQDTSEAPEEAGENEDVSESPPESSISEPTVDDSVLCTDTKS